jgi:hypothetical protein
MHGDLECLTVFSNSRIAARMIGYGLIDKDLKACLECIRVHRNLGATDDKNRFIKWATFIALCTTYGKCFVSASGRRIKLETSIVPTKYVATHDKLMTLRHNYTAHGGGYEERGLAPIGLNPDLSDKRVLEVGPVLCLYVGQVSAHDLGLYERLVTELIVKVAAKVEEGRVALRKEIDNMDIEHLYAAAHNQQPSA